MPGQLPVSASPSPPVLRGVSCGGNVGSRSSLWDFTTLSLRYEGDLLAMRVLRDSFWKGVTHVPPCKHHSSPLPEGMLRAEATPEDRGVPGQGEGDEGKE